MEGKLLLLPHGDRAVDVVFENVISPAVNARVHALSRAVLSKEHPGIINCIPGYRVLTVEYDPLHLTYGQICLFLRGLSVEEEKENSGRLIRIPVCYGGSFGPDLEEVAERTGVSVEEVIRRHTAPDYHVYMLGFRPGFPYLGGLDPVIACPRRATPRQMVEQGSVGIAGAQTGVYPEPSPGGWNLIGRTPLKLFDEETFSLIRPGDTVRFERIDETEYKTIEKNGRREE